MLDYFQGWEIEEVFFAVAIVLAVLFVIYAVTMIHQKLRVIETELQALRKDQSVISHEIEIMARFQGMSAGRKTEPGG